jgi:hypothetical protein
MLFFHWMCSTVNLNGFLFSSVSAIYTANLILLDFIVQEYLVKRTMRSSSDSTDFIPLMAECSPHHPVPNSHKPLLITYIELRNNFYAGGAAFKGERPRPLPCGLHWTQIRSRYFTEPFASLKSRKVNIKEKQTKKRTKNCRNLNLMLLVEAFIFLLPRDPHNYKSGPNFMLQK